METPTPIREPKYISQQDLKVSFEKHWVTSETEVDQYLQALKHAIMEEIKQGNRVEV